MKKIIYYFSGTGNSLYTANKIATQLVENDYINCNGISVENEGTAEQWEEQLQSNSDNFQYLINEKNEIRNLPSSLHSDGASHHSGVCNGRNPHPYHRRPCGPLRRF